MICSAVEIVLQIPSATESVGEVSVDPESSSVSEAGSSPVGEVSVDPESSSVSEAGSSSVSVQEAHQFVPV